MLGSKIYFEKIENYQPRPLLLYSLNFVVDKGKALDIGAGVMTDVKKLLSFGFGEVIGLEPSPESVPFAKKIETRGFEFVNDSIENYNFPVEEFSYINAQYSLFYLSPENFKKVFERIKLSLKSEGIFTFQILDGNNGWDLQKFKDKNMSFFTEEEFLVLLDSFEVIFYKREDWVHVGNDINKRNKIQALNYVLRKK